ncbi:putative threonine dehydratase biosynthetic, chloroplastic-like [Penaeus vannamei]|uniref:L-serine ammonia-lyase n=1 Tax=Penaeus vannamei TaxID=6689 RepID=A0A3R7MTB2_PENVA|nr:putative threonine dehydratase biosynthetic, chloroplastic-like [Penaeus vannamei]
MTSPTLSANEVATLVEEAESRIRPYILATPLLPATAMSRELGVDVYLKLENEQVTGSFKARGAFNKTSILANEGVTSLITASTGNHGLACAAAFKTMGVCGRVVVPVTADPEKKQKLKDAGAELLEHGNDAALGESYARSLAEKGGGTIGKEILQDLDGVDAIFVSVGGGGLVSGIAAYVKAERPQCKIVGCSPRRSKVMHESVRAGHIIEEESEDTLSDGTAGGVERDSVTFPLCRDLVDRWVLVEEEEIAQAVYYCLKQHKKVVEGAAGVALAAVKKTADCYRGQKVVAVMCGANIKYSSPSLNFLPFPHTLPYTYLLPRTPSLPPPLPPLHTSHPPPTHTHYPTLDLDSSATSPQPPHPYPRPPSPTHFDLPPLLDLLSPPSPPPSPPTNLAPSPRPTPALPPFSRPPLTPALLPPPRPPLTPPSSPLRPHPLTHTKAGSYSCSTTTKPRVMRRRPRFSSTIKQHTPLVLGQHGCGAVMVSITSFPPRVVFVLTLTTSLRPLRPLRRCYV